MICKSDICENWNNTGWLTALGTDETKNGITRKSVHKTDTQATKYSYIICARSLRPASLPQQICRMVLKQRQKVS